MNKLGSFFGICLMIGSSFAFAAADAPSCDISRQDLLIVRARLACQLSDDLPTCANALMVSDFMRPPGFKPILNNSDLEIQVALADPDQAGVIEIALAEWAGERAHFLQPQVSVESLRRFLKQLPQPRADGSETDRRSRAGLEQLVNSTTAVTVPIESTVFWLRNISYSPTLLEIILDTKLSRDQIEILEVLMSNQGQAMEMTRNLRLIKADVKSLESPLFTRSVTTIIGRGVVRLLGRALKGDIDSMVRAYGKESLHDLGVDFAVRFSMATLKVAQSHGSSQFLVAPMIAFGQSKLVQFIGLKTLAFLISSFQPPGFLFAMLEMTFRISPTACDEPKESALPLDTSCQLNPAAKADKRVLIFLDSALQGRGDYIGPQAAYLEYDRTCRYYQGLARVARRDAELSSIQCESLKATAQFSVNDRAYSLTAFRFPLHSRNPGGIRQIVVSAIDRYSSNSNIAGNYVYGPDGEELAGTHGLDAETASVARMAALRMMSACHAEN